MYQELLPIGSWLLLITLSVIPTICVYHLGRLIQQNFAELQGNVMGVAVKLGGPAAFYVTLLILGRVYVPSYAEITLKGTVKDVDGRPLMGYHIAVVHPEPARQDGQFEITARRAKNNAYTFLVSKGPMYLLIDRTVEDSASVPLEGFPDERVTKIEGPIPLDQSGEPLPPGYTVVVEHDARPVPATVREGNRLEVEIANGQYRAIIRDPQKRQRAIETISNVREGGRHPLPTKVNLTD